MAATALAHSRRPYQPTPGNAKSQTKLTKLWLCVYFPDLALESLHLDLNQAVATLETVKGRPCLQAISVVARQAGIEPGMSQAAALALCPNLSIRLRDPEAEHLAMLALADAAASFSPWLSLDRPQCLLLEIQSCLSLFGGPERLREKLRQNLLGLQHRPVIAISPSSEASFLLAKLNTESLITDSRALRSILGPLPINALQLDPKTEQRLLRTGIRQMNDLWRLPRDGLTRRYGTDLVHRLDTLTGHQQTAVTHYQPPPAFYAYREMPIQLERIDHFFPAIVQLAEEFAAFLLKSDSTALGLNLDILHHSRPATPLELTFRNGSRDAAHWLNLLREKLERSPLPAPVMSVAISSKAIVPFRPECFSLFDDIGDKDSVSEWQTLLDQLQARLGHTALKSITWQDDHRPEYASSDRLSRFTSPPAWPARPLWLLSIPKALNIRGLRLQAETERIESGWWDGLPVRRDYRTAQDSQGRKLWIFQDLNANGAWFLHGLFG